ncbi:FtsX-like permease family protein [Mucilaginibacter limnophilus]|uniref:FtsX-like permease family protein n=1 Tax=Mucilaginibacter limnophilus TaxID=1932778 RepID=A0A437MYU8_9SPHI|nr:FtsX-like permease family protein [Mucilaginibacter limnophilus]RVU02828.1 FtsX-like permease family protein [Mucilaginibacter limnophilus]
MVKHLFKLIWNKKKQNFLLFSEIFVSFLVIFGVFTFGVYAYKNYMAPMNFEYEDVWVISYTNPLKTENTDSLELFYSTVKQNIKAVPGVIEASYQSANFPFSMSMMTGNIKANGRDINPVNIYDIDDDYAKVLNAKMVEGRWYNKSDAVNNKVIVINKKLKETIFGSGSAVGKYVDGENAKDGKRIIGVVEDLKTEGDYQTVGYGAYRRLDTAGFKWIGTMLVKVKPGADAAFEGRLYKTMANSLKNSNVEIEHLNNKLTSKNKFTLVPLIILSIVAAFLIINVALGLFGVLWYNINKRRGEIGLRRAIGATGDSVSWQLVGESLILATFSLLIGSFFAVQFPLLNVFDLPAIVYVISILLAVIFIYLLVLICALYPGKQAANIYPAVALHEE